MEHSGLDWTFNDGSANRASASNIVGVSRALFVGESLALVNTMGNNRRQRHLERIIRRSVPKPVDNGIREVKPSVTFKMKRWAKVAITLGWMVAIALWGWLR